MGQPFRRLPSGRSSGNEQAQGLIAGVGGEAIAPEQPITREQLSFLAKKVMPEVHDKAFAKPPRDRRRLQRRVLSRVLYAMMKSKLGI